MLNMIVNAVLSVVGRWVENEADVKKIEAEIRAQLALAQVGLNAQEAKHKSRFVAGWRPMVGWICAFGLAIQFLLMPIAGLFGFHHVYDAGVLTTVLVGMLGLSGTRSVEKVMTARATGAALEPSMTPPLDLSLNGNDRKFKPGPRR